MVSEISFSPTAVEIIALRFNPTSARNGCKRLKSLSLQVFQQLEQEYPKGAFAALKQMKDLQDRELLSIREQRTIRGLLEAVLRPSLARPPKGNSLYIRKRQAAFEGMIQRILTSCSKGKMPSWTLFSLKVGRLIQALPKEVALVDDVWRRIIRDFLRPDDLTQLSSVCSYFLKLIHGDHQLKKSLVIGVMNRLAVNSVKGVSWEKLDCLALKFEPAVLTDDLIITVSSETQSLGQKWILRDRWTGEKLCSIEGKGIVSELYFHGNLYVVTLYKNGDVQIFHQREFNRTMDSLPSPFLELQGISRIAFFSEEQVSGWYYLIGLRVYRLKRMDGAVPEVIIDLTETINRTRLAYSRFALDGTLFLAGFNNVVCWWNLRTSEFHRVTIEARTYQVFEESGELIARTFKEIKQRWCLKTGKPLPLKEEARSDSRLVQEVLTWGVSPTEFRKQIQTYLKQTYGLEKLTTFSIHFSPDKYSVLIRDFELQGELYPSTNALGCQYLLHFASPPQPIFESRWV